MANQLVRELIAELPWAMRDSVEGYVDAVAFALNEIEKDAGVKLSDNKVDLFFLIIAIRRIWAGVNSQYWILHDTVSIAKERHLEGFRVGREVYSTGSDSVAESRQFRTLFNKVITKLEIEALVSAKTLADVLRILAAKS